MSLIARAVTRGAAPALARRAAPMLAPRARTFMSSIEDYGEHCFKGAVADKYLAKQGLPAGLLEDPSWTTSATTADSVAKAIMAWAGDKGASVFTHWFQPLGASGVRLGMTGQVRRQHAARRDSASDGPQRTCIPTPKQSKERG